MKLIGLLLVLTGLSIIFLIFGPVMVAELRYYSNKWGGVEYSLEANPQFPETGLRPITPVDKEFSLVIPKINLNVEIFPEIDPSNPEKYLPVLRKGVAHAKGSAYPDEETGNVFLFGHSTDTFYNIGRYNAVFFLINKLHAGDEIDIFYRDKRYQYEAIESQVVEPDGISSYLKKFQGQKTLTLQTCYPPGTTLQRLLVIAKAMD
jgi:LPXTG-site transpeptidase (sortase) family protein